MLRDGVGDGCCVGAGGGATRDVDGVMLGVQLAVLLSVMLVTVTAAVARGQAESGGSGVVWGGGGWLRCRCRWRCRFW